MVVGILVATGLGSLVLLTLYRPLAIAFKLVDSPNARSQHEHPTVVGGGVIFAIVTGFAVLALGHGGYLPLAVPIAFAGAGITIALVGLADDRQHLSTRLRLSIYGVVVAVALYCEATVVPTLFWLPLAVFMVWVINLFNFMDGIDGIAATQALCVTLGMAALSVGFYPVAGGGPLELPSLAVFALVLAAAVGPFPIFNWPPASMFMGDAGSVFLGFALSVLGLLAMEVDLRLATGWLILMMPFLVDTTGTLFIRLCQGHLPHVAHRDHVYQRLAARYGSPVRVNLGLLALWVCWQFPLAWTMQMRLFSPVFAVIISTIPSALLLVYARRNA